MITYFTFGLTTLIQRENRLSNGYIRIADVHDSMVKPRKATQIACFVGSAVGQQYKGRLLNGGQH